MPALKTILYVDALTCAVMGVGLALCAPAFSTLSALPQSLVSSAGWLLFLITAFMAVVARQAPPWPAGV
jgi:hypothetical protein